jgi:hypothetical protein
VNVAADLYHRAAGLRPHDFHTQYRTAPRMRRRLRTSLSVLPTAWSTRTISSP